MSMVHVMAIAVFGIGMALVATSWLGLLRHARMAATDRSAGLAGLAGVMVLWMIPLALGPVLFSRDVYSYAAQGELAARGLDPYAVGPAALGPSPFARAVDPVWRSAPSPYGPLFLGFSRAAAAGFGHRLWASVVAMRVLAVASVLALVVLVPLLAAQLGRPPGPALVLGVGNPLVMFHLVSGAHNEAAMVALVVAGVWLAVRGRRALALLACTLAAAIKLPALVAVVFVAWTWAPEGSALGRRVLALTGGITMAAMLMWALVAQSGLGWGWISAVSTPGRVRSMLSVSTMAGTAIGALPALTGRPEAAAAALQVTRIVAFLGAAMASGALLLVCDRQRWVVPLGTSLVLFAVLGPALHPWYLLWGVPLLAAGADWRMSRALVGAIIGMSFVVLPGGSGLFDFRVARWWLLGLAVAAAVTVCVGWAVIRDSSAPRYGLHVENEPSV